MPLEKKRLWIITAVALVLAVTAVCIAVIAGQRDVPTSDPTPVTTTAQSTTQTITTTPPLSTTSTTTYATSVITTKRRTTAKTTTRRTVKPPPIVVEPDNVQDDTVKKPDQSLTKPTTPNGVSVQHVLDAFGGRGNLVGIDVSRHQGTIRWNEVKAAGIQFAIIRCGYRTTVGGEVYQDANFKANIEGAIQAGIPVGVYFFSAAKNETEALEEAAFVIEVLKPYKEHIHWPVAFDFEIFDYDRLEGVPYSVVTENAMAFMDTVAAAGYTPMLYSSRNMFWNQWETARLSSYRIWMAHYVNTLDQKQYNGERVMWQCASDGRVNGIDGDVDLNIAYRDLANIADPVLPPPSPDTFPTDFDGFKFNAVCEEVKLTQAAGLRISPFEKRPNIWTAATKNSVWIRTGIDTKNGWSRLWCDGVTVYVQTDKLNFIRTTVTITTTTTTATTTTSPTTTTENAVTTTTNEPTVYT